MTHHDLIWIETNDPPSPEPVDYDEAMWDYVQFVRDTLGIDAPIIVEPAIGPSYVIPAKDAP